MKAAILLIAFVCFTNVTCDSDKLIAVQALYRHGDRTPVKDFPKDPYSNILFENLGAGALTNAGKRRQYRLGQWLRKRYNKFLSPIYKPEDFNVISDDLDRCMMSAAANLAGLYPPKSYQVWDSFLNWQPIPIHLSNPLLNGEPPNCPIFDEMLDEILASKNVTSLYTQKLVKYLEENTGSNITSLIDIFLIRDTLYIIATRNLPLPEWAKSVYPYPLTNLAANFWYLYVYNKTMAQLSAGPLLHEIFTNFETVTQKFRVYSGHDSDVTNVLNTITTYGKIAPEFATVLIFELRENSVDGKYVRVLLKRTGDVEEISLRNCGKKCNFEEFRNLIGPLAMSLSDRDAKCAQS